MLWLAWPFTGNKKYKTLGRLTASVLYFVSPEDCQACQNML